MFNIGLLVGRAGPLIKLTDRMIPQYFAGGEWRSELRLQGDGTMLYLTPSQVAVSGEWFAPGATAGIYADYQCRATHLAGSNPTTTTPGWVIGQWNDLLSGPNTMRFFGNTKGRFLLEIRDKATSTIQASARIWNHPDYAP